jgi:hypothetical protein
VAVAFDKISESHTGTTGAVNTYSWTHTPVGTPRGVVVFVCDAAANRYPYAGVTYGGVAMTAVTGSDAWDGSAAPEGGSVRAYFLGSGIPTGAVTVQVTEDNAISEMVNNHAYCVTVTAGASTSYAGVTVESINSTQTLAELNINDGSPGTNSLRLAMVHSGAAAIFTAGGVRGGANSTETGTGGSMDLGSGVDGVVYETTPGQGSRPVGFAYATADDVAAIYLAVIQSPLTSSGTGAPSLPILTASGAGKKERKGVGAPSLPVLTASGSGSVTPSGPVTHSGSGAVALPVLTASGAGKKARSGIGAAVLPLVTASGAGKKARAGTGAATLPLITASGAGKKARSGEGAATLLLLTAAGVATRGLKGSGSTALPLLTASGDGQLEGSHAGSGDTSLPVLTASGTGFVTPLTSGRIGGDDVPRHPGWNRKRATLKRDREREFTEQIRDMYRALLGDPRTAERAEQIVASVTEPVKGESEAAHEAVLMARAEAMRRRADAMDEEALQAEISLRFLHQELREIQEQDDFDAIEFLLPMVL